MHYPHNTGKNTSITNINTGVQEFERSEVGISSMAEKAEVLSFSSLHLFLY